MVESRQKSLHDLGADGIRVGVGRLVTVTLNARRDAHRNRHVGADDARRIRVMALQALPPAVILMTEGSAALVEIVRPAVYFEQLNVAGRAVVPNGGGLPTARIRVTTAAVSGNLSRILEGPGRMDVRSVGELDAGAWSDGDDCRLGSGLAKRCRGTHLGAPDA